MKAVVVPAPPERAFETFTNEMSAWWPLESPATAVRFEGAVGGRIVEYGEQGQLGYWGTVSDWDPPQTVSFTWHPGGNPRQAGHVTVTFRPVDGGTEVELTHDGWDRYPDGIEARSRYDSDWDHILDLYVTHHR